jgi:hypothetical protein
MGPGSALALVRDDTCFDVVMCLNVSAYAAFPTFNTPRRI